MLGMGGLVRSCLDRIFLSRTVKDFQLQTKHGLENELLPWLYVSLGPCFWVSGLSASHSPALSASVVRPLPGC